MRLVNFPVESSRFRTTGENGMSVYLIAKDTKCNISNNNNEYQYKMTPMAHLVLNESYIGCDDAKTPEPFHWSINASALLRKIAIKTRLVRSVLYKALDRLLWAAICLPLHRRQEILCERHESRFFPNKKNDDMGYPEQYLSYGLRCVIELGVNSITVFDNKTNNMWRCTYSDLTDDGKKLHNTARLIYPNCEIRLLTFLDT